MCDTTYSILILLWFVSNWEEVKVNAGGAEKYIQDLKAYID